MSDPLRPQLSLSETEKLGEYQRLLDVDARRLGLIGFSDSQLPDEISRSLLFNELLPPMVRVIDVGSGAGLPGIPLAIVRGNVHLVEPHARAVGFLEKVIRVLEIDATVHLGTAEQVSRRGDCSPSHFVVARALAPIEQATRICADLCLPGAKILLTAKSDQEQPELDSQFHLERTMEIKRTGVVQRIHVVRVSTTGGS